MNSYDPKTEEVPEDFFSDTNGYEQEEIVAISALKAGEQYDGRYGNHTVLRTK